MKHHLDNVHLRRRLEATCKTYAPHAVVQKEITARALERLQYIKQTPQRILDLSWHQGDSEVILRKAFPRASYIACAPVLPILQQRKRRLFKKSKSVCVPFANLPFAENSVDCIFMSLTMLWTYDWPLLLRECYRVLQSNGMLLFTTLGPDTLLELRHAFAAIDSSLHIHDFVDMHDIGDALVQAGFENPVMDLEHVQMHYQSLAQLTLDLKKTGCTNAAQERRQALMTPRQWLLLENNYQKLESGELCATFEFVYGHAWVGEQKRQQVNQQTNEISIPLSNIKK
jgi:malonyl-CoA O-methyltransferase